MQQTVINSRECIFACRLAPRQSRPDNLYLLGLCCCGPLLMTLMCAVARRNAVLQEDKALFARFSRPGVLETCVGRLLCIWHWRIRKEGRVINQGNDRHQGKVPTHCQVSLSAVDKLIKSGHMAPSGLPLFSVASVLLLQCYQSPLILLPLTLPQSATHVMRYSPNIVSSHGRGQSREEKSV